jgi:hypothetical protein
VIGLLGLYETGVDRLVLWHQTVPSQETLSLFGESEDELRFFLEGTRATSLQEALPNQIAEITVHSGAVTGVANVGQVSSTATTRNLPTSVRVQISDGLSEYVLSRSLYCVRSRSDLSGKSRWFGRRSAHALFLRIATV